MSLDLSSSNVGSKSSSPTNKVSLTGVTLTVKVLGDLSKLLDAPLSSLTWKVKLA